MTPDNLPGEFLEAIKALGSALGPAAIGSAVAQAWQKGLDWRQRLLQWVVGICVSYYVTLALGAWLGFNDFVAQGVGFVIAMIAFEAAPKFIRAAGDAVAGLPGVLSGWLSRKSGGDA
jgi:hypothetical protein